MPTVQAVLQEREMLEKSPLCMQEENPDHGHSKSNNSNNIIYQEKGRKDHNGNHEQGDKDLDNNQEKDGINSKVATA
jgi:hypothetical protein